ncbi:MAG: hypothetical protein H8E45_11550 [Proteobacteria bacterium]|nr:hypothetical protein [Pseudomonadota bacterium]
MPYFSFALPRRATTLASATLLVSVLVAPAAAARDYVPAVSNPVLNESPRITTELRPIYMYNWIPGGFVTGGGYISLVALQFRIAINDRLAVIATKDGWADIHFDAVLPDEDGFANVSAGLKYSLLADEDGGRYLSVGGRYELPVGNLETAGISMQGKGDGMLDLFVTGETAVGERSAVQASLGLDLAIDGDHDSSLLHASVTSNCELAEGTHALVEVNVISTADKATRTDSSAVGSFEGFDLVNFGSTDSGTVATLALGLRHRITERLMVGVAWETPISAREDIIDQRITADAVITF